MPIALTASRLIRKAGFQDFLVFGRQRGLLSAAQRLGRIERRMAPNARNTNCDPLAAEIGIFGVVECLRGYRRGQQGRQNAGANQISTRHLFPLVMASFVRLAASSCVAGETCFFADLILRRPPS
jgi:hypothetical protein